MRLEEERKEVLQACRDLVENGFVRNTGGSGNVSVIDFESRLLAITPSQVRYDVMEPEDVVVIDTEGRVVEEGTGHPTFETPTHTLIYREIGDVGAVIHSHPIYSIALSSLYDEIPSVYIDQTYFFGPKVPVIDYVTTGSEEMAEAVVPVLEEYPGLIIRNHGLITTGESLDEALRRTFVVEENAEIYYRGLTLGEPEPFSG